MPKEVRVEFKVKNNLLYTKMQECGIESVAELCRQLDAEVKQVLVGQLMNMKKPARKKNGEWLDIVLDISELLRCLPEDIFSPDQQNLALETNRATAEIGFDEMQQLGRPKVAELPPEALLLATELKQAIKDLLDGLNEQQRYVLIKRFGLDGEEPQTLAQVGEHLNLSKARISNIEHKALRLLRHPTCVSKIIDAGLDDETVESRSGYKKGKILFSDELMQALRCVSR